MNFTKENIAFLPRQFVDKHMLITGQTGSGKTCTARSLIYQLQKENETVIILDPTGEYTKLPNMVVYTLGENTFIDPGSLEVKQLLRVLDIETSTLLTSKVEQAIESLKIQENIAGRKEVYLKLGLPIADYQDKVEKLKPWMNRYPFALLTKQSLEEFVVPKKDDTADYTLVGQVYDREKINQCWDDFMVLDRRIRGQCFLEMFGAKNQTGRSKYDIDYILSLFLEKRSMKRSLVLDLSRLKKYGNSQKYLMSLILKKILAKRMAAEFNFKVSLFIDEAHRYLPQNEFDMSENGFFQLLREGRKYGISLVLATQSPLDISPKLLSQISNFIIHRTTTLDELEYLNLEVPFEILNKLDVGQAVIYLYPKFYQKVNISLPEECG